MFGIIKLPIVFCLFSKLFVFDLRCQFGSFISSVPTFRTATEVACVSPDSGTFIGPVRLRLTHNDQDFSDSTSMLFTFTEPLHIYSIPPPSILINRKTDITLYGSGFRDVSTLVCNFANRSLTYATFISPTGTLDV